MDNTPAVELMDDAELLPAEDAATALRCTVDAVRKRGQRNQLRRATGPDGRTWYWIPRSLLARPVLPVEPERRDLARPEETAVSPLQSLLCRLRELEDIIAKQAEEIGRLRAQLSKARGEAKRARDAVDVVLEAVASRRANGEDSEDTL